MCRSIKTLRGAEPPATTSDIQAASLQFVRKISGYRQPSRGNQAVFDRAVSDVAEAVTLLLEGISTGRPAPSGSPSAPVR